MKVSTALIALVTLSLPAAWGQQNSREPSVGYVFPAGGQRGTTFEVLFGGQYLNGAKEALFSGEGMQIKVVKYYRGIRNLNGDQRRLLQTTLKDLREARLAELRGEEPPAKEPEAEAKPVTDDQGKPVTLPEHPALRNLETKSLKQLICVADEFFNKSKSQPNAQIADTVLAEVTLAPDAPVGMREVRLRTSLGLTNPVRFQVGTLPEAAEQEPNDPLSSIVMPNLPKEEPLELPVLVNGQVKPGDVDRLPFRATEGQKLVIDVAARRLVPFLADAVPGWFQATVAVYDEDGNEVAFADDYEFEPDPVMLLDVPKTGVYELEIRDAIYRGRQDFVYRVALGELPFVTSVFPLGGSVGTTTTATLEGWNLPQRQVKLDTAKGPHRLRELDLGGENGLLNPIYYAVDSLPETSEKEPNDTRQGAQSVALPQVIDGRFEKAGDLDWYRFSGHAGDEVVVEVTARRLHSPVDSLVRLVDASGKVLAWNDDYVDKLGYLHRDMGILTHHADSYLRTSLPAEGEYFVQMSDIQNQGGSAFAYRLRVSYPQHDFDLMVSPCSLLLQPAQTVPVWLHALRRDGFTGPIEVSLEGAPKGFYLTGNVIPQGRDSVRMTLTAPGKPIGAPFVLNFVGRSSIEGYNVERPATPARNTMQAFLWRHLVPTEHLMVSMSSRRWWGPRVTLADPAPVRVPQKSSVQVRLTTGKFPAMQRVELTLSDPPKGISVGAVRAMPGGASFELKADAEQVEPGFADNLILEGAAFVSTGAPAEGGQPQTRRIPLGTLPAIPFEVVAG